MSANPDGDWTGEDWDMFTAYHRKHTVHAIESSAYVISLVPDAKKLDVKFAVELGLSIMMNKPIIAIVIPGVIVPPGLRKVAETIIVADLDTEAGRNEATRQIKDAMARWQR